MFTCTEAACPSLVWQGILLFIIAGGFIPALVLFVQAWRHRAFLGTWRHTVHTGPGPTAEAEIIESTPEEQKRRAA